MDILGPVLAAIATATVAGAWLAFRQAVQRVYADSRAERAQALIEARADHARTLAALETNTAELRRCIDERAECRAEVRALRAELQRLGGVVEAKLEARHDRDARGRFVD